MDILISGVGGQGTILASKILAGASVISGNNARTGETIGMSQRGGCVVSHVRTEKTASPYIPLGQADLILSFELCEGARNIPQLKNSGTAIVNTAQVNPTTVALGISTYDTENIKSYITKNSNAIFVDANSIAKECGSVKAVNTVLVGIAFGYGLLNLSRESLIQAIKENVKPRFFEMNCRAFELGEQYALNNKG